MLAIQAQIQVEENRVAATQTPAPYEIGKLSAPVVAKGKASGGIRLSTDTLSVSVQVVSANQGETNLHAHADLDEVWWVLAGEATFYGTDDDVEIAVLGKDEAIRVPAGAPYWFKCSSEENLAIMHITAKTKDWVEGKSGRVDYRPKTEWFEKAGHTELADEGTTRVAELSELGWASRRPERG